ncbi:MAG: cyclic pyranopterin monophosphate synthase MoaC [Rhodothermaceae bacterium]
MNELTHVNQDGKANMVDVSGKNIQYRQASAEGFIFLSPETVNLIKENKMKKGDVLTIAEIAGIQGGKKTSELIPLCHPLQISKLDVRSELTDTGVRIESYAKCIGQTGIEMEALTAVNVALLTIYDMCKAADKEMKIGNIKLINKEKSDTDFK